MYLCRKETKTSGWLKQEQYNMNQSFVPENGAEKSTSGTFILLLFYF